VTQLNILRILDDYPKTIGPIAEVKYEANTYQKFRESAYRISDTLYVYGDPARNLSPTVQRTIQRQSEEKTYSLLLRHLILCGISNATQRDEFDCDRERSRLVIRAREPSIRTDHVSVYETLELQTLHWQDVNFGVVIDYRTRNRWSPQFEAKAMNAPCSYQNIRSLLPQDSANELLLDRLPELRGERYKGRWRSDALKQRFNNIDRLLRTCMGWNESERVKTIDLPTGQQIRLSKEFSEVIMLGEY